MGHGSASGQATSERRLVVLLLGLLNRLLNALLVHRLLLPVVLLLRVHDVELRRVVAVAHGVRHRSDGVLRHTRLVAQNVVRRSGLRQRVKRGLLTGEVSLHRALLVVDSLVLRFVAAVVWRWKRQRMA
uniref:(northern house mosquito) hypothetical protein n=1 Tax=Culex pipiens TaxID=7175 RepID=A0A8D8JA46_CULPI